MGGGDAPPSAPLPLISALSLFNLQVLIGMGFLLIARNEENGEKVEQLIIISEKSKLAGFSLVFDLYVANVNFKFIRDTHGCKFDQNNSIDSTYDFCKNEVKNGTIVPFLFCLTAFLKILFIDDLLKVPIFKFREIYHHRAAEDLLFVIMISIIKELREKNSDKISIVLFRIPSFHWVWMKFIPQLFKSS